MSCKSGVGPLQSASGSLLINAFIRRVAGNVSFSRIDIISNDVIRYINKCKNGMSSGPDGIPQYFLKKFGMFLIKPLTAFYRHLLEIGAVPLYWKLAYVTPIFLKCLF